MSKSLTLPALPPVALQWIDRIGGPRRAAIAAAGLGSVLLILAIARWASAPEWVPVARDLPLESVGEISDRLTEEGIPYRLEQGGTELMVAASDLARARVSLARDGGLDLGDRPGLELFDQPSWGMTDFTQRINYRRALEGELERTIAKMRGVEAAKVHLALSESPTFRQGSRAAEASVVLRLSGGARPDAEVVRGIAHLVSSSVDGVEPERVSVLDDTGRLLSSPYAPGSPGALATRELETRRAIEQYLQVKAEELVGRMVGPGNVRVQVSADINYDQVQRTTESVDPERQALASEQRAEIIPGAEGGAGSSNVTASYLNSRTVEQFSGEVGGIKRLTVAVLLNDAAANADPWSPQQLTRVEQLVQNAVGLDRARGDQISVASVPFREEALESEPSTRFAALLPFVKPGLTALALLMVLGITFLVVRALQRGRDPDEQAEAPAPEEEPRSFEQLLADQPVMASLPSAYEVTREEVAGWIQTRPDASVRALRMWLKED